VNPTDPLAVGEAITRLLLDSELARALGAGGAERARSLAWPAIAERVQALLLRQLPVRSGGAGTGGDAGSSDAARRHPEDPSRAPV
jgi:hypothetical protein